MRITSLGFRTDLMLLSLPGSQVEDRGDHLLVRSPRNPGHWWGNFLRFGSAPQRGTIRTAMPDRTVALGGLGPGRTVVHINPLTGRPDVDLPDGPSCSNG